MKLHDINFLDIKKIGERYISLAHYNNNPIIFNLNNLEIKSKIYKEENILKIDFLYEENLLRLLKLLEKYICEYVHKKNNIKISLEKFIEQTFYSKMDDEKLKIEVHKNCLFIEEDELLNCKQINFSDIKVGDYSDIKIHFLGINFLEKNFEGIFIVRKIVKQIENEENINELVIESDQEEEINYLEDDEKITKLINNNFKKIEINI